MRDRLLTHPSSAAAPGMGWSVEDGRGGKGNPRMSVNFQKILLCMFSVDNDSDACER